MTDKGGDWTQGEPVLLTSRCAACSHAWYLPRAACPRCGGREVRRTKSAGAGVVFASTTVHRLPAGIGDSAGPIGIALVDLDEGIRVMGRCAPGTEPGVRVLATFVPVRNGDGSARLVPSFETVAP